MFILCIAVVPIRCRYFNTIPASRHIPAEKQQRDREGNLTSSVRYESYDQCQTDDHQAYILSTTGTGTGTVLAYDFSWDWNPRLYGSDHPDDSDHTQKFGIPRTGTIPAGSHGIVRSVFIISYYLLIQGCII